MELICSQDSKCSMRPSKCHIDWHMKRRDLPFKDMNLTWMQSPASSMTYSALWRASYISHISNISKHWRFAWVTSVVFILGLIEFIIDIHPSQFLCNQEHNIKSIKAHSAVLSSNGLMQAQKTSISRANDPMSANQMAKHSNLLRWSPTSRGIMDMVSAMPELGRFLHSMCCPLSNCKDGFKLVERFVTCKTPFIELARSIFVCSGKCAFHHRSRYCTVYNVWRVLNAKLCLSKHSQLLSNVAQK